MHETTLLITSVVKFCVVRRLCQKKYLKHLFFFSGTKSHQRGFRTLEIEAPGGGRTQVHKTSYTFIYIKIINTMIITLSLLGQQAN